jgi:hypothetical protein
MKLRYILIAVATIVVYNVFLIQRDKNMFEAYDHACATLPQGHPDCIFAKPK